MSTDWTMDPRLDVFTLEAGVGKGPSRLDLSDEFWQIQELKTLREDIVAMVRLRSLLAEELGSACLIRMSEEQLFEQVARLLRQGRLYWPPRQPEKPRGQATGGSETAPSSPPPPPPRLRTPSPAPPAPATVVVSFGPAAAARIEAADSGVPFWICCEACGY